jgi:hypothetical protein
MVPTDRDAQDNTNDDSILDLTNAHLSSLLALPGTCIMSRGMPPVNDSWPG